MSQVWSGAGNLGAKPERRTYKDRDGNEQPIAVFSIACNRRFKREGQPDADWFQVKVFGPQAQSCLDYLDKGRTVFVVGTVELSRYPHKTATNEDGSPVQMLGVEVNASNVTFIGGRGEGGEGNGASAGGGQPAAAAAAADDLPF